MNQLNYKNILLILGLFSLSNAQLPKAIRVCSRNNPKLPQCIIESVKRLQPSLATGKITDDFQIPPLEPLKVDSIKIERGKEFKASFGDLLVTGPSNFTIDKMKVNLDNFTFDFIISLPRLDYVGKYVMKIKLLLLNIQGQGDFTGSIYNSRARVRMHGIKTPKDGKTLIQFEKFIFKIQIGSSKLKLDNLFNGDPTLGQLGNQFINENIELFLEDIIPGLENNLADFFTNIANDIVSRASFEELFPEEAPNYDR